MQNLFLKITFLIFFSLILSCSNKDEIPPDVWYSEHYKEPSKENQIEDIEKSKVLYIREDLANIQLASSYNTYRYFNAPSKQYAQNERSNDRATSEEEKVKPIVEQVKKVIEKNEEVSEIQIKLEKKLFSKVEKAFLIRDYSQFLNRWHILKESYPLSKLDADIKEMDQKFFHSEQLDMEKLSGAMVEIKFPHAKTLEELENHFKTLFDKGIRSVLVNVAQSYGEKRYLFAKQREELGVYFNSLKIPIVDPILSKIVKAAHKNKLKLFAEIPLREHPWIRFSHPELQDEIWNPLSHEYEASDKLDLLNPGSVHYLKNFIREVLVNDVDGVIFASDYSYKKREGFSSIARLIYHDEKKKVLNPSNYFKDYFSKKHGLFESIYNLDFFNVVEWRRTKIHIVLRKLITMLKKESYVQIGIKLIPEMVVEKEIALANYSTTLESIAYLDSHFFMIDWKKNRNDYPTDFESYRDAALLLNNAIRGDKKRIILKHPLSNKMMNIVQFNKMSKRVKNLGDQVDNVSVVIGPIDRLQSANMP